MLSLVLLMMVVMPGAASAAKPATESASEAALGELLTDIAKLAAPSTTFVELRESKLLKEPLRVSGRLERRADGSLVRSVELPHREESRIVGGRIVVERAGRTRSFSLARAPEIADAMNALDALLRGNPDTLKSRHRVRLVVGENRWTIVLDARGAKGMDLWIHGSRQSVRCIVTRTQGGSSSRMLIDAIATGQGAVTARDFDARCTDATGR